jgi:ABC-type multidrug transport system fused ATPase/permease subunit
MILINHGFAVSANNNSQQIVNNKQKKSTFSTWWWRLIILACFALAGVVFGIVVILLMNNNFKNFINEMKKLGKWKYILICTGIALIYGLFPSICHFFWSRCFLKNKYIQAKIWLIAFWVLVGIAIAFVLVAWVAIFVSANKSS